MDDLLARSISAFEMALDCEAATPLDPRATRPLWIRRALAVGRRFHNDTAVPLAHNALNLGVLAALLAQCVALAALGPRVPWWAHVALAGPLYGWTFFALAVLVVHEASHGMFVLCRGNRARRRWNRAFGWAVAIPLGIHYARHWERGHVVHHNHPLEPPDPQRAIFATGPHALARLVLLALVPGWAFVERFGRASERHRVGSRAVLAGMAAFWLAVAVACVRAGTPSTVGACLVGLQVTSALNKLKGALEHGGPIGQAPDPLLRSRTTLHAAASLLLPFCIGHHFEHHLCPGVPWYRLPRMHRALRPLVPRELQPALFNTRPLAQLLGRVGGLPASLADGALAAGERAV